MHPVTIHLLPRTSPPVDLKRATAVVIDVLRATTTIVTALEQGADCVVPVAELETARAIAGRLPASDVLLGGERGGRPIEGFDLDNSPCHYTRDVVAGKQIIFTTSHGTQAIDWARHAGRLLVASFSNLNAVVEQLVQAKERVHIVCAGTDGSPSIEDSLCAAVIAGRMWERQGTPAWPDDTTLMLLELYRAHGWTDEAERTRLLTSGRGGRRLTQLGCQADIAWASKMNTSLLVPELDCHGEPARLVAAVR
ncbi:MAG: 2-phosphosulfolactate phosphatase [Planctomycetota bacterium]